MRDLVAKIWQMETEVSSRKSRHCLQTVNQLQRAAFVLAQGLPDSTVALYKIRYAKGLYLTARLPPDKPGTPVHQSAAVETVTVARFFYHSHIAGCHLWIQEIRANATMHLLNRDFRLRRACARVSLISGHVYSIYLLEVSRALIQVCQHRRSKGHQLISSKRSVSRM
jgi:hypothetical protein